MSKFNKKSKLNATPARVTPVVQTPAVPPFSAPKAETATIQAAKPRQPSNALPAVVKPSPIQPAKPALPHPNRVLLELFKPDAKNVCVAGSFNNWQPESTPLKPAGNGRWVGDLEVKPGRHEYLFVVDGQWLPDPKAKEAVQNPYGGSNSVLVVSE